MLIDFPNYSNANPWQVKTIQTSAPMEVNITNKLETFTCYALHISWEDFLLKRCHSLKKANQVIAKLDEYLNAQRLRSKIIWTVHNLTSHTYPNKDAEKRLRAVIMEHASVINLMSMKHSFLIPQKYHSKINLVPFYIEPSRFFSIPKNTDLTFFRYGADRGKKDHYLTLKILNHPQIKKFVSDSRLNIKVDNNRPSRFSEIPQNTRITFSKYKANQRIKSYGTKLLNKISKLISNSRTRKEIENTETVITNRRFTFLEADLYAQLSNFSTFYQEPKFNSAVMNFMIGNKLAVFHDKDSVRYMDLPDSFDNFCLDLNTLTQLNNSDLQSLINIDHDDVDFFIAQRSPKKTSNAFWKGVLS